MLLSMILYMYYDYITSVTDTPTIARSIPTILENVYPSYRNPEQTPKTEYKEIVNHLMDYHRKDIATSSEAELDLKTFVVLRSH